MYHAISIKLLWILFITSTKLNKWNKFSLTSLFPQNVIISPFKDPNQASKNNSSISSFNLHRASPSLALTRTPRIIPVPKSEPIKREKMSPYRVRTFKSKVNCVTSIEHSFDSYLRPLLTHHYVFHLRSQGRTLPPIYSSSQRGARWESC